jgi:hypothetical protein
MCSVCVPCHACASCCTMQCNVVQSLHSIESQLNRIWWHRQNPSTIPKKQAATRGMEVAPLAEWLSSCARAADFSAARCSCRAVSCICLLCNSNVRTASGSINFGFIQVELYACSACNGGLRGVPARDRSEWNAYIRLAQCMMDQKRHRATLHQTRQNTVETTAVVLKQ